MRSIMKMAISLITVFVLASCSSTSSRSVATDEEGSGPYEYRTGKRLINETNY